MPRRKAAAAASGTVSEDELTRLMTHEMIRCFVDDFRSQTGRGGRVRYRMVKYLIG